MASSIALTGLPSNEFSTAVDGARGARPIVAIGMGRDLFGACLALVVKIWAAISMEIAIGITLASMKSAICPAAIGFAGGMGAFRCIVMTAGAKNRALLVALTTLCLLKGSAAIVRTGRPARLRALRVACVACSRGRSAVACKVVATTAMIQARSVALAGV